MASKQSKILLSLMIKELTLKSYFPTDWKNKHDSVSYQRGGVRLMQMLWSVNSISFKGYMTVPIHVPLICNYISKTLSYGGTGSGGQRVFSSAFIITKMGGGGERGGGEAESAGDLCSSYLCYC